MFNPDRRRANTAQWTLSAAHKLSAAGHFSTARMAPSALLGSVNPPCKTGDLSFSVMFRKVELSFSVMFRKVYLSFLVVLRNVHFSVDLPLSVPSNHFQPLKKAIHGSIP